MSAGPVAPHGIIAMLYAFFDANGRIDADVMAKEVDLSIATGVHGVAVLGLATEVRKLAMDEKLGLIAATGGQVAGRVPFVVTIAGATTEDGIHLADAAAAASADWLILQPPSDAGTPDELSRFFAAVADATRLPVAIQNAPGYFAASLSADDLVALSRSHANIAILKAEGSAVDVETLIRVTAGRFPVFNGRGGLELVDSLRAGCAGMILAPDLIDRAVAIYDAFGAGDAVTADRLYAEELPAIVFIMQSLDALATYGKRLFALRAGLGPVHDRLPGLAPTPFGLSLTERLAERLGPFRSSRNSPPASN